MGAKVTITGVVLGTGASHQWRGVVARAPRWEETAFRIELGIRDVPTNGQATDKQEAARKVIIRALDTLVERGRITSHQVGSTGSVPRVFFQVERTHSKEEAPLIEAKGAKIVGEMRKSRTTLNPFVLGLADELRQLLDEVGAKQDN